MIILDTNVVSEPLKPAPGRSVLEWLDQQNIETLFLTTISLAELRFGVAALPHGRRKDGLRAALDDTLMGLFGARVLGFDTAAANSYAEIRVRAKASGKAIGASDGYIAAIAASHGFMVATRDTATFVAAGVQVVDPWMSAQG